MTAEGRTALAEAVAGAVRACGFPAAADRIATGTSALIRTDDGKTLAKVEIIIDAPEPWHDNWRVGVNWSAIGTVPSKDARLFGLAIIEAAAVCRRVEEAIEHEEAAKNAPSAS